jgi:hypothetical protein
MGGKRVLTPPRTESASEKENGAFTRPAAYPARRKLQKTPAIAMKSFAVRLAPPTSAPSTSSTAINSAAFEGFTDPP